MPLKDTARSEESRIPDAKRIPSNDSADINIEDDTSTHHHFDHHETKYTNTPTEDRGYTSDESSSSSESEYESKTDKDAKNMNYLIKMGLIHRPKPSMDTIDESKSPQKQIRVAYSNPSSTPHTDENEGKSIEIEDPTLPHDWRAVRTIDKTIYYYNIKTRDTTWKKPKHSERSLKRQRHHEQKEKDRAARHAKRDSRESEKGHSEHRSKSKKKKSICNWEEGKEGVGVFDESKSKHSKEVRSAISQIIVKVMSRYKSSIEPDKFKKLARKVVLTF